MISLFYLIHAIVIKNRIAAFNSFNVYIFAVNSFNQIKILDKALTLTY